MKRNEDWILVQRLVDGELTPAEESSAKAKIAGDPELQETERCLRSVATVLQGAEAGLTQLHRVGLARESYWGGIEQRIGKAMAEEAVGPELVSMGGATERGAGGWRLAWLRWFAPVLGVATLALLMLGPSTKSGSGGESYFVESDQREASSVVFRSESDGVTVHWLN